MIKIKEAYEALAEDVDGRLMVKESALWNIKPENNDYDVSSRSNKENNPFTGSHR